jgi:hypothetical protein
MLDQIIEFLSNLETSLMTAGLGTSFVGIIGILLYNRVKKLIPGVEKNVSNAIADANQTIVSLTNIINNQKEILNTIIDDVIENPYITQEKKEKYIAIQLKLNAGAKVADKLLDIVDVGMEVIEKITQSTEYGEY